MAALRKYEVLSISILIALLAIVPTAWAQSGVAKDDFYNGKTIRIIVTTAAGGGYDLITRAAARYLPKYIPGKPTVIVENMPGAGSLKGTNYIYNVTAADSTVVGQIGNQVAFAPLLQTPQVHYDPLKFHWLGSPSSDIGLLIVWHTSPVNTIEDARHREVLVATSGGGSTSTFYARVLNSTLGLKLKILTGYNGTNDAYLAMERGEVDGFPSVFWSSLKSSKPDWIRDKKVKYLVQYGNRSSDPQLRDVPFAEDLAENPADKQLLQIATAPLKLGEPFVMPPEVPGDHVELMRNALMSAFRDSGFVADATKQGFDVEKPETGKQLEDIVRSTYGAPKNVIDRLVALSSTEDGGKK